MSEQLTVDVEALSNNGEGIARHDGLVHFVPRALPGERCDVEVVHATAAWRRAHIVARRTSSSERVEPACPHYADCGGCQLQHMDYAAQLRFKRAALAETLRRIGKIEFEPSPVVASPPFGYRRKVTFAVRVERGHARLCLHRWDRERELVAIERCPQLVDALNETLPAVAAWLNAPPLRGRVRNLRRLVLREDDGALAAALLFDERSTPRQAPPELQAPPGVHAVFAGADKPGAPLAAWVSPGGAVFPAAFRQANAVVADLLYDRVAALAGDNCRLAIDAYAGAGELALRLAWRAERVIAIEQQRDAVSAAQLAVAELGLGERVRVLQGRVETLLRRRLPADLVVLDPPRVGCHADVVAALRERPPATLAYVSCHPATLARDLRALLDGGMALTELTPFDMFPQTHHVEALAVLKPAGS